MHFPVPVPRATRKPVQAFCVCSGRAGREGCFLEASELTDFTKLNVSRGTLISALGPEG